MNNILFITIIVGCWIGLPLGGYLLGRRHHRLHRQRAFPPQSGAELEARLASGLGDAATREASLALVLAIAIVALSVFHFWN